MPHQAQCMGGQGEGVSTDMTLPLPNASGMLSEFLQDEVPCAREFTWAEGPGWDLGGNLVQQSTRVGFRENLILETRSGASEGATLGGSPRHRGEY